MSLRHFLGQDNPSGDWYLAWSGWVGNLGYLGIILATLRRHRCEVSGCHRIARKHPTAAGHHCCKKHHPEGKLTAEHVHRSHWLERR